jgi:hypothetical protein
MNIPTKSPAPTKAPPTKTVSANAQLFIAAREHASRHRASLEAGERCGCFFCFRTFPPTAIKAWIDGNQTALCPHCGIDAVLGAEQRIDIVFLRQMHQHHFAYRSK